MVQKRDQSYNLLDELMLFNRGEHYYSYEVLGCHFSSENGIDGYRFTVYAPHAKQAYVKGDFSEWNEILMQPVFESGCWSVFIEQAYDQQKYKFVFDTVDGSRVEKIDPFAFKTETPPNNASIIVYDHNYPWDDDAWMRKRYGNNVENLPLNIYEVHASSWKEDNLELHTFDDLVNTLIPYVKDMGYTHIELLPVMEHPLDASWGYQITGYFSISGYYGDLNSFKRFVNACHKSEIGVILDFVPGHFCQNFDALAYYDGTPTFEYEHPIRAKNKRWGAMNFDLGKKQVHSFLISSAMYWLKECHIDGLRIDAVSNMLYLDYDEPPHVLNEDGTNINHFGIEFLRKFNDTLHHHVTGIFTIAEESTAYRGVTHPTHYDGLGFDFKWNMGWMNDTLRYFEMNPEYRNDHFNLITFVLMYQYHEHFVLALSHDEVVHGKRSLLGRMPNDRYNQFAQLRLLYGLMLALPGKILNFMGNEIGQFLEWRFQSHLEWKDLEYPYNREYQHYIKTINRYYASNPSLYVDEFNPENTSILEAGEQGKHVLTILRRWKGKNIYIVLNFDSKQYDSYQMGVLESGTYRVVMNSEMREYGGAWSKNHDLIHTQAVSHHYLPMSIDIILPTYGVLIIEKEG